MYARYIPLLPNQEEYDYMPNAQETTPVVNSVSCYDCSKELPETAYYTRDSRTGYYCESCYDEHQFSCDECGDSFDEDDMTDGYCDRCWSDRYDNDSGYGVSTREYNTNKLPKFMSKDEGEYIKSSRIFSAELECYYNDDDEASKAVREVAHEYGVETDGSLNSRGLEFQTPMLQGAKGEQSIIDTCAVLNKYNFYTDRSTGLHIHLDGAGLIPRTRTKHEPTALAQAFMFYISFEDVLMSFLPPSRRANRYCMSLRSDYHAMEIARARSLEALEKIWYRAKKRVELVRAKEGKYHDSRYFGLNLHSLLKDGHVEIRFHSGTLNATKILEWTNLHQTILDKAVGERYRRKTGYDFAYRVAGLGIAPLAEEPKPHYMWSYRHGDIGTKAMHASNLTSLAERTELMFTLLDLPTRARKYFLMRQKAFTSTEANNDEEVCAG